MSGDERRPAEAAARQHAASEAQLAVSQMAGQGGHSAAVLADFPGISVEDRTDARVTGMDLPPVPASASTHTGPA